MPGIDLLMAFGIATLVFAYMPGPAMLYTAAQTLARGRRAGMMAAFGIHCGGYVHVVAAALGLSALLLAVPTAYAVLKFCGAAYLIFLGVQLIRQRADDGEHTAPAIAKSPRRAFFDSVIVEVLNPKAALFFLAFLPQFVDPSAAFPVWVQFLILGTVVNVAFSSADVVCVVLADAVIGKIRGSSVAQKWVRRVGGGLLITLGGHLALQRH